MFSLFLKRNLQKSYSTLNKELQHKVFPHGEPEYIYVGTILNALFKEADLFKLIQIYASVYTYYKLEMGNSYTTFVYTKKKAAGILTDYESKTLIALVMLNTTSNKTAISDPVSQIDVYRRFVIEYISFHPLLSRIICQSQVFIDNVSIPQIGNAFRHACRNGSKLGASDLPAFQLAVHLRP